MARKKQPIESNTTASETRTTGSWEPKGFEGGSGNRESELETADDGSSSPPPSSSFPGISGENVRRTALVGAAREEDRSEDEMTSYLKRSAKLFS